MKILKGRSPGNRVRFRPGFGLAVARGTETGDPTSWSTILTTLKTCKKLRIVQVRIGWSQLESTLGTYGTGGDWAKLEQWLDDLNFSMADGGPRDISIFINTKLFHQLWNIVPAYMLDDPTTGTYNGGQNDYPTQPGFVAGRVLCFDNANVVTRFTALANEIGRRYRDNPRVHIIGFPESSYGATPSRAVDEHVHFDGVLTSLSSLKAAMPTTLIRTVFNYPRDIMDTWVTEMVDAGIHLGGGPNSAQDEDGLSINSNPNIGEFQHLKTHDGVLGKLMEIQRPEMQYSNLPNRKRPASTWGTLTLADNGGFLQLQGSGAHGMTAGDHVDTFDAEPDAGIEIENAVGNFPAGYLDIKSVDSANNLTVINRSAWSGPTLAAGALRFSHVASRSLTSPAAQVALAPAGGYPYGTADGGSGNPSVSFTYDPGISGNSTGYVPSKKQLIDFCVQELSCNYIMITYETDVNSRSGLGEDVDFIQYLNTMIGNHTFGGGLVSTRPTNVT